MTQSERRTFLIRFLQRERGQREQVPTDADEQRQLLRALMNVRQPYEIDDAFLYVQDAYLQEEARSKGIVELNDLSPLEEGLYLWQGDITTLQCGAIVNAANSGLTGCCIPCHRCIDNTIHTFAGVQLRRTCAEIIRRQGHEEPAGCAKLTPAYNLPCDYILHTVGPIVGRVLTERDEELLASCYRSCLELADENGIDSIAFCCISTGEFRFPNDRAAQIAVQTVRDYRKEHHSDIKVIFNVFKDLDDRLYRALLG